jgi:hypothetical protein
MSVVEKSTESRTDKLRGQTRVRTGTLVEETIVLEMSASRRTDRSTMTDLSNANHKRQITALW